MRLDAEDSTSDEYDFMDDVEDSDGNTRARQPPRNRPKQKYMNVLQEVADRKRDHIYIDLDDLDEVWCRSYIVRKRRANAWSVV